jgi:hypothetical protein
MILTEVFYATVIHWFFVVVFLESLDKPTNSCSV